MRPFLVVLALAFFGTTTLLAQLRVGLEAFAPDTRVSRAPGDQSAPLLATDGKDFLVAWVDGRAGQVRRIYASRIAASGQVLDPLGIPLTEWPSDRAAFGMAFGRSSYLMLDSGFVTTEIDVSGHVIARHAISVGSAAIAGRRMVLRWTGADYLAVWGYQDLFSAFIGESGTNATEPLRLVSGAELLDTASSGQMSMVVYTRLGVLSYLLLDRRGSIAVAEKALPENPGWSESMAAVGTDGRNFLLAWSDSKEKTLSARLIGPDGVPLHERIVIARQDSTGTPVLPRVSWDGNGFVVGYYMGDTVVAPGRLETVSVDAGGTSASAPHVEFRQPVIGLRDYVLASAGSTTLFAGSFAHPQMDAEDEIFAKPVGTEDALALVTYGRPAGVRPSIASNGSTAFAVWEESRGSTVALRDPIAVGSLWTADGTPLSGPFEISFGGGSEMTPTVVAGRSTFLVQWHGYTGSYYRIFTDRGVPLTAPQVMPWPETNANSANAAKPAVWTGQAYAVIRTSSAGVDVLTISENGSVESTSQPLNLSAPFGTTPALMACNDSVCVAAWIHVVETSTCPRIICTILTPQIRIARYSLSGALLDTEAAVIVDKNQGPSLALTRAGDDFYLAWQVPGGTRATRLTSQGVPSGEEIIISTEPPMRLASNVTMGSIGGDALVVWSDNAGVLRARTIARSSSGTFASSEVVIGAAEDPSVTAAGDHALIAYDHFLAERGVSAVFVRSLTNVHVWRRAVNR